MKEIIPALQKMNSEAKRSLLLSYVSMRTPMSVRKSVRWRGGEVGLGGLKSSFKPSVVFPVFQTLVFSNCLLSTAKNADLYDGVFLFLQR